MLICTALLAALCVSSGMAYSLFRQEIPNGDQVPHPCKPNFVWHGVGHQNAQGGGKRNPFGQDFEDHGKVWTEALCRKDSDGDGKTNGEELGDPNCVWSKGQTPEFVREISHPGVCDPWNEGQCVGRNDWLDCSKDLEFNCDAVNEPEVRNITLRFPRTKVPAKETTYLCYNFELPSDQDYHLIATKPFIDNENVMHHMVLTGCDSSVKLLEEPEDCLMGSEGCRESLGGWTLGMSGECLHPSAGIPMGKNGAKIVSLQHHWTNPTGVDTWYDSSGITLFYTAKLRQYNAAAIALGQTYLSIPPGQERWVHEGTCKSKCTRKIMRGDINVVTALNHMHYLGIRQNVTVKRAGGGPEETIVDENPFNYDSPVHHQYNPPFVVRPGDELKTACTFQSRSRDKTTMYGEGSYDEMCLAFLTYFPAENIARDQRYCAQWKDLDSCDMFERCDLHFSLNVSIPEVGAMYEKVLDNCDPSGHCRKECPAAIAEVRAQELRYGQACLSDMWDYTKDTLYRYMYDPMYFKFAAAMESCSKHDDSSMARPSTERPRPTTTKPDSPSRPPGSNPGSMLMDLIKHTDDRPLLQNIVMNVNYNYAGDDSKEDDHAETWH